MYKVGDIITCTNIVDYRHPHMPKMKHIFLGHIYKVLDINKHTGALRIQDVITKERPGLYSTIFFIKEIVLSKHIKVL